MKGAMPSLHKKSNLGNKVLKVMTPRKSSHLIVQEVSQGFNPPNDPGSMKNMRRVTKTKVTSPQ